LSIIKKVEDKFQLPIGSISKSTIVKRCQCNNPEANCPQKEPPLNGIGGLLMEWLIRLSKMNEPLTKSEVMHLCDDLIRGTIYEDKMKQFCSIRHIEGKKSGLLVGTAWYEGFMQGYEDVLTRKRVKLRDANRRTWCTMSHFSNMYHAIYKAMVECGVAIELDEENCLIKKEI
jgi:hypothetical protein